MHTESDAKRRPKSSTTLREWRESRLAGEYFQGENPADAGFPKEAC